MKRLSKLALLQLEHYDTRRYFASTKKLDEEILKRLVWTPRLRATKMLSYPLGVGGANLVIGSMVRLYENWMWKRTKSRIKELKKHGLKVVAIAGSYGKTSVKHFIYDLVRHHYRAVATPASYNTILGIAKCLEYEVDEKTELFVVEVGAYQIGDITRLLQMVQPDVGVLTGMARQHLERFGSFENIQVAKSEIAGYMARHGGKLVANGSDETVRKNVEKLGVKATWYRGRDRHEINLSGAKEVAKILGIAEGELDLGSVRVPKSRFEMTTKRYGMAVIDDSFSSNEVGFLSALEYLKTKTSHARILVTPGLVELGSESDQIHAQLGKEIIGKVDYVILVGRNARTKNLEKGLEGKVPVEYVAKTLDFMSAVQNLKLKKKPLVLLENDVPENY